MLPVPLSKEIYGESSEPCSSTIAALFSQQAARTPDAVAVIAGDRRLSYREVDERSSCLAVRLQGLGVKPDTLVGIAMGRSEMLVISLLATLRAGGAYVPLDPNYPKERLSWMIEDSEMPVLLTTAETHARLPANRSGIEVLDVGETSIAGNGPVKVNSQAGGGHLAYVIYTSGSTGKPKGVMVENRNVVNFFRGMKQAIGCEPGVWLAVTSVSFDISVLELLWTLTCGFTVVMHGDAGSASIADEITLHHATHLQMTPSLARMLTLDARTFPALGSLRQILLGGEAVPASLIHRLRQVFHGQIYNMYGPTETTIWSTSCLVEEVGSTVSIGRPILDTQIHLLDSELKPVAAGLVGELFIAGDGVARGYWNRPDLSAERFLNIPSISDGRLYRTGDLARLLPDGNLEFLGRADYQIKLRGHRIEPGEIEALLEQRPGITQAVVVAREDREGDVRLVAYLVASPSVADRTGVLRQELESKLPEYMVPSSFVFLSELPLTDNGKIDRKALLKLPPPALASGEALHLPAGPSSAIENIVTIAWQDALGIPAVGMNENFFDLGAHSLTVAEVQARLQDVLGCEIPLVDLFQFSAVRTLAAHLAGLPSRSRLSERAQRRRMARRS